MPSACPVPMKRQHGASFSGILHLAGCRHRCGARDSETPKMGPVSVNVPWLPPSRRQTVATRVPETPSGVRRAARNVCVVRPRQTATVRFRPRPLATPVSVATRVRMAGKCFARERHCSCTAVRTDVRPAWPLRATCRPVLNAEICRDLFRMRLPERRAHRGLHGAIHTIPHADKQTDRVPERP